MDANGNFKVEVGIVDLEALRGTIKSLNNEKNGLLGLIRQLKNGETTLDELFMNGTELRVVKDNVPVLEPTANILGGSLNGDQAAI